MIWREPASPEDIFDKEKREFLVQEGGTVSRHVLERIAKRYQALDTGQGEFHERLRHLHSWAEAAFDESFQSKVWVRLQFTARPKKGTLTPAGMFLDLDGTHCTAVFQKNTVSGHWTWERAFHPGVYALEQSLEFTVPEDAPRSVLEHEKTGITFRDEQSPAYVIRL